MKEYLNMIDAVAIFKKIYELIGWPGLLVIFLSIFALAIYSSKH